MFTGSLSTRRLSWLSTYLVFLTTLVSLVSGHSETRGPLGTLFPVRNASIHTHNHRITALSHFDLSFILSDNHYVKLSLEPNHEVIQGDGINVRYLRADGTVRHQEVISHMQHRVYLGTAWIRIGDEPWNRAGHARATVDQDGKEPVFQATFDVDHDMHHVLTTPHYMSKRHDNDPTPSDLSPKSMVLWRTSDIVPQAEFSPHGQSPNLISQHSLGCQSDMLHYNNRADHPIYTGLMPDIASDNTTSNYLFGVNPVKRLFKRIDDNEYLGGNSAGVKLTSTIGQNDGCPKTRKVARVGIATDCTYTAAIQKNASADVRQTVIDIVNRASAAFENTFNINLALVDLTISDAECPASPPSEARWNQPCSDSVSINDRLSLFSQWRGGQNDNNSHWTLLSTCNTGSAVGLAWLGAACNKDSTQNSNDGAYVSGANVVVRTQASEEWQVLAHETGHTFGAVHDCNKDLCSNAQNVDQSLCCPLGPSSCDADAKFLMNPSTNDAVSQFSQCTMGNVCSAMKRNTVKTHCLAANNGTKTISDASCGNGIVEGDEECDCGGDKGCKGNSCCDPKTCKFTSGSQCDPANEPCCNQCKFAAKDTICRESTSECDPEERCSGTSATCPEGKFAEDGTDCGGKGSGLQCASGQCTSRDRQCQSQFGPAVNISSSGSSGSDPNIAACDDSSCTLTCSDKSFGPNFCIHSPYNFLDGTPCGFGGMCDRGSCEFSGTGLWNLLKRYQAEKPAIFYSVLAAVILGGLFLLGCIWKCLKKCIQGRRSKVNDQKRTFPATTMLMAPPSVVFHTPPPARAYTMPPPPQMYQQAPPPRYEKYASGPPQVIQHPAPSRQSSSIYPDYLNDAPSVGGPRPSYNPSAPNFPVSQPKKASTWSLSRFFRRSSSRTGVAAGGPIPEKRTQARTEMTQTFDPNNNILSTYGYRPAPAPAPGHSYG